MTKLVGDRDNATKLYATKLCVKDGGRRGGGGGGGGRGGGIQNQKQEPHTKMSGKARDPKQWGNGGIMHDNVFKIPPSFHLILVGL